MKKKKMIFVLLLITLGIGFAITTTKLIVDGTVNMKSDISNFSEYVGFDENFSKSSDNHTNGSVELTDLNKTIIFKTNALVTFGDKATFKYKIRNNSSYTTYIKKVICEFPDDSEGEEYFDVTTDNSGIQSGTSIAVNSVSEGYNEISISLKKTYADETPKTFYYQCRLCVSPYAPEDDPNGDNC